MEIILKDQTYYEVEQEDLILWSNTFPNIDVYAQIMIMASWSLSNPSKRKTKAGIQRFVNGWLTKANQKGKSIEVPIQSSMADVSWIPPGQLRIECQERFLAKYGFYYLDGTQVNAIQLTGE